MPRFLDTQTGRTVEADGRRADYFASSPARFQPLDTPPDGTVDEVLAWAGDDPDRRAAALEAEKAGKGRKTLIDALS